MARHDLRLHSDACLGVADERPSIDTLIRSGMHKVFPLPAEGRDEGETFRLLLAALARRHGGSRRTAASFAGHRS